MTRKKEALCIVAHPDDETIWMGGAILKNKFNWTIISLCRKNDLDREPKFRKAYEFYNAKGFISDLEDDIVKPIPIYTIINKINSLLPKKRYDLIFTHGENGEYGHLRHIEIHKAVKKMLKYKNIITNELFFFSYKKMNLQIPQPLINSDYIIKLNQKEYKDKINLITKFYGFSKDSFEAKSCNKIEAYTKI